jgi:hypothetical protein
MKDEGWVQFVPTFFLFVNLYLCFQVESILDH